MPAITGMDSLPPFLLTGVVFVTF